MFSGKLFSHAPARVRVTAVIFTLLIFMIPLNPAMAKGKLLYSPQPVPQRVLFIGNSYTQKISQLLTEMLNRSPYQKTEFEFITKASSTLQQHLSDKKTRERIATGNWTLVVLQEQSQLPALPGKYGESFQTAVDTFSGLIRAAGAEPVLYMTWGHRDGDQMNKTLFPDYLTMQNSLKKAYDEAATRNELTVVPVGEVWSLVRQQDEQLGRELYQDDSSHPSVKGSFLAACTFFRVLFRDPLDNTYVADIVTKREERLIETAVLMTR